MAASPPGTPGSVLLPPAVLPALDPARGERAPDPGPADRVALLVCHGMGQQVRFQTLMDVAGALQRAAGARVRKPVGVRPVRIGREPHALDTHRVELSLETADGALRHVHLYEAYWAPLTEGRVSARDVVAFLWGAAWNGVRHAWHGEFRRWMFDRLIRFPIQKTSTLGKLCGALLVVSALLGINAVVAGVGIARIVGIGSGWPDAPLVLLLAEELAALLGVAVVAGTLVRLAQRTRRRPRHGGRPGLGLRLAVGAAWVGIWLALLATVGLAGTMGFQVVASVYVPLSAAPFPRWLTLALVALWLCLLVLSRVIRYFLVQYVGDVAAYISAHAVSRFQEIRAAVQETSYAAARALYTALEPDGRAFAYGRVVVVGHSLGSVIAYDTLNAMVREDRAATTPFHAVARTPLLLTFGSPLNKTAFLFRAQLPAGGELREVLAASVQPMIQRYELRPARWVNLYARGDWIGGPLEFYDDPDDWDPGHAGRRVENEIDPEATTPLAAHVEHWTGSLLGSRLVAAIGGSPCGGSTEESRRQRDGSGPS